MSVQPAHDGADTEPIPDPTAPAKGTVVDLTHVERVIVHIRPGQRGTVIGTYQDAVLVEMMVPVRKAVSVDRLRTVAGER